MYIWTTRLDTAYFQNVKLAYKMSSYGKLSTWQNIYLTSHLSGETLSITAAKPPTYIGNPKYPNMKKQYLKTSPYFCPNVQSLSHVTFGRSKKAETSCFKPGCYNFVSTFLNTDRSTWDTSKMLHFTFRFNMWHHSGNGSWPLHS